jgi:ADP-heptose:LPS heptosyltransferase
VPIVRKNKIMLNRLKGFLYDVALFFATIGVRRKSKVQKALIVRTDEIGDYMLWRKFIADYVASDLLKGYELHLCGNPAWKDLLLFEYPDTFAAIKWLDKKRFKKSLRFRFFFLRNVFKENYTLIINPIFSRSKRVDDAIVKAAKAQETIGMLKNNENYAPYEHGFDRKLYTMLFEWKEKPIFEFSRNKLFAAFVTGKQSDVTDTRINPSLLPPTLSLSLPKNYIVVFPGSGNRLRIWPPEYFSDVASYISEKYGYSIVVCGGPGDREFADAFVGKFNRQVVDIVGKTSLVEMLVVLQQAKFLISVDTGAVHLAAAVGCPIVGIFNGSQYGRFAPYPAAVAPSFQAVYPDSVEADISKKDFSKYEFAILASYATVSPEKVIRMIK